MTAEDQADWMDPATFRESPHPFRVDHSSPGEQTKEAVTRLRYLGEMRLGSMLLGAVLVASKQEPVLYGWNCSLNKYGYYVWKDANVVWAGSTLEDAFILLGELHAS